MRIVGDWFLFDDGESRPILRAKLRTGHGTMITEQFLVDTGADRTVFTAALLRQLALPAEPAPPDERLLGIGGAAAYVVVESAIELTRDDGGPAVVRGRFTAFTDPLATDVSVMGRDVLSNFDVIVSRPNSEVLLLAPGHRYQVVHS
jgi:hypothetical protein